MELKTPLYDRHVAAGGKIVPFAGYLLPVQYGTGVLAEHMAVRTKCGLFDVSHMGEVTYKGKDALANVNAIVTNDCTGMFDGQARYSPMCNDHGGCVDDLIVYKMNDEYYYVVVNAANRHKDADWMRAHVFGDCKFEDVSDTIAQLALQGPLADKILRTITDESSIPEKYYSCVEHGEVAGIKCIVSKTGYTGEDGYELYCASGDAVALWDKVLAAGKDDGLIPCGLGARDTLRLEAAMPLYGHEMNDDINPFEARLGIFVKLDKECDFVGKKALAEAKPALSRRRVGLVVTGRGIAREECPVYDGDKLIGEVSSGTYAPFIKKAVAMAILPLEYGEPGTKVTIDVRGNKIDAEVVKLPFYKRA